MEDQSMVRQQSAIRYGYDMPSVDAGVALWWHGSPDEFAAVRAARAEIHRRDVSMKRTAWHALGGTMLVAVSIYSSNAIGAFDGPSGGVVMPFSALFVVLMIVWLLDRRLAQQVRDTGLQAKVWEVLIDAVRSRKINAGQFLPPPGESEVDRLLREEAILAARFVGSRETLTPHIPLFDESIELSREKPGARPCTGLRAETSPAGG